MQLIVRMLEAGLLIWLALFVAILFSRFVHGETHSRGFLQHAPDADNIAPERVVSMAAFPLVVVGYAFTALHTDVAATHALPELPDNLLLLLTGGNGIYLAGKIARLP